MEISLKALTDIHIGTGEIITPLEYIIYNGVFYKVPQKVWKQFLDERIPDYKVKFAHWIGEQYEELANIEHQKEEAHKNRDRDSKRDFNQKFSRLYNDTNPLTFCKERDVRQETNLIQFLEEKALFKTRLPDEGRPINFIRGDIREAIKAPNNLPYIPGSTLKGALRTALLFHWMSHFADDQWLETTIRRKLRLVRDNIKRPNFVKKQLANDLEVAAFYCETEQGYGDRKKIKKDDEKLDLMKLLSVTDAHLKGENNSTPLSLADVKLYLVEKQRDRNDRNKMVWVATSQRQTNFAEAINKGNIFSFRLDFNIDFLFNLKEIIIKNGQKLNDGIINSSGRHWIKLEDKVKQIFGLNLGELTKENKEEKKKEVLDHILDCVRRFTSKQISADQKWWNHFEENDPTEDLSEAVREGFNPIWENEASSRLFHFGYATGFNGVTEYIHFLSKPRLKDLFKEVMELFRIGDKPGNRREYRPKPDRFPKSRRLTNNGTVISPMGWAQLILEGDTMIDLSTANEEVTVEKTVANEPPLPIHPVFFNKAINPKRPPILDAEVMKSGKPNRVKVYVKEDYCPELDLNGYRNAIELGTIIRVNTIFNKQKKLVQISYKAMKK